MYQKLYADNKCDTDASSCCIASLLRFNSYDIVFCDPFSVYPETQRLVILIDKLYKYAN